MRFFNLTLLLLWSSIFYAQDLQFLHTFQKKAPGYYTYNNNFFCEVASDGRLFLAGNFSGEMDLDNGEEEFLVTSGTDEQAFFIAEYSTSGSPLWAKTISGSVCRAGGLYIDPQDTLFITGHFRDTVDFDPGVTGGTRHSFQEHAFILKLTSAGDLIWVTNFSGNGGKSYGTHLVTDEAGNIYCGGTFKEDVDFDPGPSTRLLRSSIGLDGYLVKLDADGKYEWREAIGGKGKKRILKLLCNNQGSIYALGDYTITLDFDEEDDTRTEGATDIWLAKHPTGNLNNADWDWYKTYGGIFDEFAAGLEFGENTGKLLVSGNFTGKANFNLIGVPVKLETDEEDGFLMQVDAAEGKLDWVKKMNGNGLARIYKMIKSQPGELLFYGLFGNNEITLFDDSTGVSSMQSDSMTATFMARTDLTGNPTEALKVSEGLGFWQNYNAQRYGLATDKAGGVYATGEFYQSAFFEVGNEAISISHGDSLLPYFIGINDFISTNTSKLPSPTADFDVFPNPGQNSIYLNTPETCFDLQVFSLQGLQLASWKQHCGAIDLSFLPRGLFYLNFQTKWGNKVIPWTKL